jgi:regulatory protein
MTRPSRRKRKLQPVHEEIGDLFSDRREDRSACPNEARKKAMDFLARREHGQAELIKKLAEKGFDRQVAEQAVNKLAAEGLQSDRRFAESFVQSRVNRGKGPIRIRLDLSQRGISDADIDVALDASETNWTALAREIRIKKFGRAKPADFKNKAKQMRFLQYRGFEPDQIQAAMEWQGD